MIRKAERCLEAGADMIMIDADDICRQADSVRADIIAKVISRLGLEKTMFEASNPKTSEWFIKQYGPKVHFPFHLADLISWRPFNIFCTCLQVNLHVDHSQVMNLECLRGGNLGKNHVSVLGSSYFL